MFCLLLWRLQHILQVQYVMQVTSRAHPRPPPFTRPNQNIEYLAGSPAGFDLIRDPWKRGEVFEDGDHQCKHNLKIKRKDSTQNPSFPLNCTR